MNISNIKKIVLEEGRVVIVDGEDALVVMGLEEYKKIKSKNLGMASALLEAKPKPQPQPETTSKVISADIPQQEIKSELTLDDLPF